MACPKVEIISSSTQLGEGPHWDHETQKLYFVDIFGKAIHRYDPAQNKTTTVTFDETVSIVIPIQGQKDKFIISLRNKIAVMTWDGESPKPSKLDILVSVGNSEDGTRINDGKADPSGRLWAGTLGPETEGNFVPEVGVLFSLTKEKTANVHAKKITVSNGLAWSSDNKHMYYIDSVPKTVDIFDFDIEKGTVGNRRILFDFESNGIGGFPDGMAIDAEDKLWVACFGAGAVIRIDPTTGKLLKTINLPSLQITSVAFGGPNLDELFVTSANLRLTADDLKKYPSPGRTFRVTGLGVKGLPGQSVIL